MSADNQPSGKPPDDSAGWDANRFRVEFGPVMTVSFGSGTAGLTPEYGADVWLMQDGKTTTRKKRATIIDDSVPALLRMMADWIEEEHDPGLRRLVADSEKRDHDRR